MNTFIDHSWCLDGGRDDSHVGVDGALELGRANYKAQEVVMAKIEHFCTFLADT